MNNEKLFDLLGDIDDKFYLEAREDDPVEAIFLKPIKRPLWQTVGTAAASVALIAGIAIGAVALKNSGIIHLPASSHIADSNSNDPAVIIDRLSDVDMCKKLLLDQYDLLREMEESGELEWQSRTMDLNFDGEDEIVLLTNAPNIGVRVFSKTDTPVGVKETGVFAQDGDTSFLESLDDLYAYEDENGEKYWYYSFEFSGQNSMFTHVAAAVKFDGENYGTEYLLSYGTVQYSDPTPLIANFYRIGWEPGVIPVYNSAEYNFISNVEFYDLWNKYPELPDMWSEDYLNDGFEFKLENFPMLDPAEVPDLSSEFGYLFPSLEMRAATIDAKKWGEYEIRLIGQYIHTESEENPGVLFVGDNLYLALCKDGEILSYSGFFLSAMATAGGRDRYELDIDRLDRYVQVFDLNSSAVAVFNYDLPERKSYFGTNQSTFLGIYKQDGTMTIEAMMGDCSEIGEYNIGFNVSLSHDLEANGNIVTDVTKGISYCFYPEYFGKNPFETHPWFAASYADENPNTDLPKELTDVKEVGGYTIKTFTEGIYDPPGALLYKDVIVTVEKDGVELDRKSVRGQIESTIAISKFSEYVQPFEMKDGIGFILYSILRDDDPVLDPYDHSCRLYMIKDGKIVQLIEGDETTGGGPIHIEDGYKINAGINSIETVFRDGSRGAYDIDFASGTYASLTADEPIID